MLHGNGMPLTLLSAVFASTSRNVMPANSGVSKVRVRLTAIGKVPRPSGGAAAGSRWRSARVDGVGGTVEGCGDSMVPMIEQMFGEGQAPAALGSAGAGRWHGSRTGGVRDPRHLGNRGVPKRRRRQVARIPHRG